MKSLKILNILFMTLIIFTGCFQSFDAQEGRIKTAAGKGALQINITGSASRFFQQNSPRTVFPDMSALSYRLSFTCNNPEKKADSITINSGELIELAAGIWKIVVEAVVNKIVIGGAVIENVEVKQNEITIINNVLITPVKTGTGITNGTVLLKIIYGGDISKLDSAKIFFNGEEIEISELEKTDGCFVYADDKLVPGSYLIRSILKKDGRSTGNAEAVHIYSGLITELMWEFSEASLASPRTITWPDYGTAANEDIFTKSGGVVSASDNVSKAEVTETVAIKSKPFYGFKTASYSVTGNQTGTDYSSSVDTDGLFFMPNENVTVSVTFEPEDNKKILYMADWAYCAMPAGGDIRLSTEAGIKQSTYNKTGAVIKFGGQDRDGNSYPLIDYTNLKSVTAVYRGNNTYDKLKLSVLNPNEVSDNGPPGAGVPAYNRADSRRFLYETLNPGTAAELGSVTNTIIGGGNSALSMTGIGTGSGNDWLSAVIPLTHSLTGDHPLYYLIARTDGDNGNNSNHWYLILEYEEPPVIPAVPRESLHWTFTDTIPGWTNYNTNGNIQMNTNAYIGNGFTLNAANRSMRWLPAQNSPGNPCTIGAIQTGGSISASGIGWAVIENIKGPFEIKIHYTGGGSGERWIVMRLSEQTSDIAGPVTTGSSDIKTLSYKYSLFNTVNITLGAEGGVRVYDVIIDFPLQAVPVQSLIIKGENSFTLMQGSIRILEAALLPAYADNKNVIWSSSNSSIAAVNSDGVVTACAVGTAVITAEAQDGSGKSGSVKVTVIQNTSIPIAFPGAEGHGRYTTGGRGGAVYYVTNLQDYASGETAIPGSLRYGIEMSRTQKMTILFNVAGTIILKRNLAIRSTHGLTIAGQSAPGDGICIGGFPVDTTDAQNVIVRFIRFRMGDLYDVNADGSDAFGGRFGKNIIVDHCSISWSTDECASFYGNENFTMQWCIVSESLNESLHSKGGHGYGAIWGGMKASFHHNLLANHNSRVPRLGPAATSTLQNEFTDLRNNVFYNYNGEGCYGAEAMNVNIVNNYYYPGPANTSAANSAKKGRILAIDKKSPDDSMVNIRGLWGTFYIDGNIVNGHANATNDNWTYGVYNQFHSSYGTVSQADRDAMKLSSPLETDVITTHTAQEAYSKVLDYAGASLVRDSIDTRIINDARSGTATFSGSKTTGKPGIIDSVLDLKPEDAGDDWLPWPALSGTPRADSNNDGIPDGWLESNYPGKKSTDLNAEGYTYLEVYLNSLVGYIIQNRN